MRLARIFKKLRRRAGGHHTAAVIAAFGSQIDDVIGFLNDLHVVLNNGHGVALINQGLQNADQALNVGQMQTGGRLI